MSIRTQMLRETGKPEQSLVFLTMKWTLLLTNGVACLPDLSWSTWILTTLVLLAGTYLLWLQYRYVHLIQMLPGPRALPILGNALQIKKGQARRQEFQSDWVKRYGPIYRLWLGPFPIVFIASPELMEPILSSSKSIDKPSEYLSAELLLGNAIFLRSGPSWKSRRAMLLPSFHMQILKQFVEIFNEHSGTFCHVLDQWISEKGSDQPFNVCPTTTQVTLDILCGN